MRPSCRPWAQVSGGSVSAATAFWALSLGIALGDLGLYGIGRKLVAWSQITWLPSGAKRYIARLETKAKRFSHGGITDGIVFFARAIPGARLPSYVGAGLAAYPLYRFLVVTVISVVLWVALALSGGALFMSHLKKVGGNLFLAAILMFLVFMLTRSLVARMREAIRN